VIIDFPGCCRCFDSSHRRKTRFLPSVTKTTERRNWMEWNSTTVYRTIDRGYGTALIVVIRFHGFRLTIGTLWIAVGTSCRVMTRGPETSW
jgi:hypothetical protein